jgi:putative transcriptional regulator
MRGYLKRLREKCGMTQQDVADKLGISYQYYSLIENGERQKNMDITLAAKIADVFGVEIGEIVRLEKEA